MSPEEAELAKVRALKDAVVRDRDEWAQACLDHKARAETAEAELARLRDGITALADDLWRVTPCGCGHRADLHTMGHFNSPGVCTGGLGLCGCDWTFSRIAQERVRALLEPR